MALLPLLPAAALLLFAAAEGTTEGAKSAAAKLYCVKEAKAFAAMAKLAYCGPGPVAMAPYGTPTTMPKLVPSSCGQACEQAGFLLSSTVLVPRNAQGVKNAEFAYVSKMEPASSGGRAPAECAVAFRGTWVPPANQNTNKNVSLVDFSTPSCKSGCQVVGGPYQVWRDLEQGVLKGLGQLGCTKGAKVALTGHSLGGQVASIAMFFMQDQLGYDVTLSYTFAQPKPFNKKAAETFETLWPDRPVSYFRVTTTNDAVPAWPKSKDIHQVGFQIWYTGFESTDQYELCGTELDAPDCGIMGIKKKQRCQMTDNNAPGLGCGGFAPYNGPHCNSVLAPAHSMCSFAGNTDSAAAFISASVLTCMTGSPMPYTVVGPTAPPPKFEDGSEASDDLGVAAATTTPPPPMDLHKEPLTGSKEDCFKNDTASSPLSMFGHYTNVVASAEACQKRCADTAYCEYFTFYSFERAGGTGGSCELSGGWGSYVPHILGVVAGPKDCSKTPPQLSSDEKFALWQEYHRFVAPNYDGHYGVEYERHDGLGLGLAAPGGFSMTQVACFGAAMLITGASLPLIAARSGRFPGLLGLPSSRMAWVPVANEPTLV